MRCLLLLAAVIAALSRLARRRGVPVHPLRAPGRRVARLRAGHARRADRRARPDGRHARPLHAPLAPDRAAREGSTTGSRRDAVLRGLSDHGHRAGRDALGDAALGERRPRSPSWAPTSGRRSPASRAPRPSAIRSSNWLIWNEPNQRRWLRPTSPSTYVRKLLNPAYAAIHRATPRREGGRRRDGSARLVPRHLAGRLHPRHGRRAGAPRRVRAQSLSAAAASRRLRPEAATTARRSRWRRSTGSARGPASRSARECGSG